MTNVIALRDETSALPRWRDMPEEQKLLLKEACNSAKLNDSQFELLVEVARRAGLDPFRRHLYGLFFDGKFTLVTGIDGFRAVARRNGLAGVDEVKFTYDEEKDPKHTYPETATVTVYRWAENGQKEAYTAVAHMREYRRYTKAGELQSNWKTKPHIMLGKCVKAQAFREAFTESLGGIYERAEFGDADHERPKQSNDPVPLENIIDVSAQPEKVEGWDDGYVTTDSVPGPE